MASIAGSLGGSGIGAVIGSAILPGIGTAIGAAVGGAIGGAIGGYVDQAFLFPAIFGRDKSQIQGARIDDFQFTTASPGTPVNWCLGRFNRLPGVLMWISPVRTVKHEEDAGGGGKSGGGGTITSYEYFVSFAIEVCEGPINRIKKIWADGNVLYDAAASPGGALTDDRYKSITFYNGAVDQLPDPIIESYEGVGNVPGFRGLAYFVVEDFSLSAFGNRIPNLNALVEARDQTLLSEAVEEIWARSGRDPAADIDTTWLRGVEVTGYNIVGPQSVSKQLEPLLLAYNVIAQEQDGILYFRRRQDSASLTLDQDVLAAREVGQDNPRFVSFTDKAAFDLPSEVDVQYVDYNFGHQKASQRERMRNAPSPTVMNLDLPLSMSGDEARSIARRVLWSAWAERTEVEFTLPPSQLVILESDLLVLPIDDETYSVRVTSVTRGSNYLLEVRGVAEQAHVLTVTATAEPITFTEGTPGGAPVALFVPMDIPLLPDKESERIMYGAVALESPTASWRGARVENGKTSAGPWFDWLSFRAESNMGYCLTALPITGPLDQWDRETTFDVVMVEGSLSSATADDVLNGTNHLYVGTAEGVGEIVAFVTATLIATNTYRLSQLLRGRRDTVDRMIVQTTGNKVVVLDELIKGKTYGEDQHNQPRYFGAVPRNANQTIDDVPKVGPVIRTSRPLRPFSPTYVRGAWDGSNNLTLSWIRRTRKYFNLFATSGAPMDADSEKYEVNFYRNDDVLARTVTVTGETFYAYSAAAQTGDGLTPGPGNGYVTIYQLNRGMDNPGRGNPTTVIL